MGAIISGTTKYQSMLTHDKRPPGIFFHHHVTLENILRGLHQGHGEGMFNLNPATDNKFVDVNFPLTSSEGIDIYWVRACDVQSPEQSSDAGIFFFEAAPSLFPTDRKLLPSEVMPSADKTISYWLAAVMSLLKRPEYLKSLFIGYNRLIGAAAVQLWNDGQIVTVIIDDFIPCHKSRNDIFTPCRNTLGGEVWLSLLEKALAKLFGGFLSLHGGRYNEIIRNLTGEIAVTHNICKYTFQQRQELIAKTYRQYKIGMALLACDFRDIHPDELITRKHVIADKNSLIEILLVVTLDHKQKKHTFEREETAVIELKLQLGAELIETKKAKGELSEYIRSKGITNKNILGELDSLVIREAQILSQLRTFPAILANLQQNIFEQSKLIDSNTIQCDTLKNEILAIHNELELLADGLQDVTFVIHEIYYNESLPVNERAYFLLLTSPCSSRLVDTIAQLQLDVSLPSELQTLCDALDRNYSHWIPFAIAHLLFRNIYVCHLTMSILPPKFTPGIVTDTLFDFFGAETSGGGPNKISWRSNPNYRIDLRNRPPMVPWKLRICISSYDGRTADDVTKVPRKYPAMGFTVCHDEPLLNTIICQTDYSDSRDCCGEILIVNDVNKGYIKSLIIVPSCAEANVECKFMLSFSIQCDFFPRGFKENRNSKRTVQELQISHEIIEKKTLLRSSGNKDLCSAYDYSISRSVLSLVGLERIAGWDSYPYSVFVFGSWSSEDTSCGLYPNVGSAAGRMRDSNKISANNPCYRLRLATSSTNSLCNIKEHVKVSLLVFLSTKSDISKTNVYALTPRGLIALAAEGACDPTQLLGETAFRDGNLEYTRRLDVNMKHVIAEHAIGSDININKGRKARDKNRTNNVFILPKERVHREIILMPAAWHQGEIGSFKLTVWSNTEVTIHKINKNSMKELKLSLRT